MRGHGFGLVWLWIVSTAAAGAAEQQKLIVHLFDYARLSSGALEETAGAARRILAQAGIQTEWRICDAPAKRGACAIGEDDGFPIVRIIPRANKNMRRLFGAAIKTFDRGLTGVYATIFYDRVKDGSRRFGADEPVLLACAIAHELGELFGLEHAPEGIMRAAYDQKDMDRAVRGRLRFTAGQGAWLRGVLVARYHGAAAVAAAAPAAPVNAK
ncbi:MAG: hypothetical protein LAQ30_01505 [Acidobacteriia bacterium]|nr:hypothetical protein [Terriglobia bacterium]